MKTLITINALLLALSLGVLPALSQTTNSKNIKTENTMKATMNTYVIEREIPNAGNLDAGELQGIAQKSCAVLKELGPEIEWVQSYVTDNKIFCVYRAENEAILRTHAMKGGFPINSVHLLSTMISPATATAELAEIK
jgi:hypothetical protein